MPDITDDRTKPLVSEDKLAGEDITTTWQQDGETIMSNPRAICGSCGKSLNEHYKESQGEDYVWYCYHADTSYQDEFTSEPSNDTIVAYLRSKDPSMMEFVILDWKQSHGHN